MTTIPAASTMRAHLFIYDIPRSIGRKFRNPSHWLWRIGVRINLSCWIVPDRNVARIPLEEWRAAGVSAELVRFDERDGKTIIRLAREALAREIDAVKESVNESMALTRDKLATVASNDEKELTKATRGAYGALWRAKKFATSAQECALLFDLTGDVQHLIDALRDDIRANDTMYYGWVKTVRENRTRDFTKEAANGAAQSS